MSAITFVDMAQDELFINMGMLRQGIHAPPTVPPEPVDVPTERCLITLDGISSL